MSEREFIDYSHEVKLIASPYIRFFLVSCALVFLALGIIGIFLPLLPTTPFILLASACYARSSVKFYNWLMNHPRLGPPLRTWKEKRAIGRTHKIVAVALIALTIIPALIFWVPVLAVKIGLGLISASVSIFILTRPEG